MIKIETELIMIQTKLRKEKSKIKMNACYYKVFFFLHNYYNLSGFSLAEK